MASMMAYLTGKPAVDQKTLRPVKSHGTLKRTTLSALTKRTLGSGNLRAAVKLPKNEDLNEWIAVSVGQAWPRTPSPSAAWLTGSLLLHLAPPRVRRPTPWTFSTRSRCCTGSWRTMRK
jgi:hypothetical protein